jgi:L-alanine-DL-glutamate epimerase-like enolase superfamily enzyme
LNVRIQSVRLPLRRPFVAAWGSLTERTLLLLELSDPEGMIGCGEAAPLPGYDGVGVDEVWGALEDCRGVLERDGTLDECAEMTVLPQALAAIDLALWDLRGRRAGQPVWQLLDAPSAPAVEVNYTIGATDRAGAATEAATARAAGFRCVKVKVGVGDDAGRIAAVRAAAGPQIAIRVDANGAWTVDEAEAALRVLAPAGIELCEEPVSGISELRRLRSPVPVALDEIAMDALDERMADAVCLKIARCGGITGLIAAAKRARTAGYQVYLASTLDGPLGIAAALHAAAVIGPDRPCGLATLSMFDLRNDPLPARHGLITAPATPGLGLKGEIWGPF